MTCFVVMLSSFLLDPPSTTSAGSWLSRLWKRSDTPGPIKASLGEETSFYYDKELKRWVNKKVSKLLRAYLDNTSWFSRVEQRLHKHQHLRLHLHGPRLPLLASATLVLMVNLTGLWSPLNHLH